MRGWRMGLVSGLLAAGLAGLTGCEKKTAEQTGAGGGGELVILCGNSFVLPAEVLRAEFTAKTGIRTVLTSGGSEEFLPLVKVGQRGDILITHDPYLEYTKKAGALAESVQVGFVAPVLAVQKGNPKHLTSIADLAKPGVKVALTDPQYSTCGEMVFKLLEKKGIKEAVLKNVDTRLTKGHSQLGTFLKTGVVDAVIMWNGVAHTFKEAAEVAPTPYEYDSETRVHVIGLSYSKQPAAVKAFVDFAREQGAAIFAEYGYVK